ncbi:MAG: hypothetical protein ACREMY_13540 [bacterium]
MVGVESAIIGPFGLRLGGRPRGTEPPPYENLSEPQRKTRTARRATAAEHQLVSDFLKARSDVTPQPDWPGLLHGVREGRR